MKPISSNEEMVGGGTSLALQWLTHCKGHGRACMPCGMYKKKIRDTEKFFGAQKSSKVLFSFSSIW